MIERKIEVISPYTEEQDFNRVLIKDENGKKERHAKGLKEFIKANGLEYRGYEKDAGYTLAIYLINLGYLVLQGETFDVSVIYLPESLTQKQYDWYLKNKKILRRIKLAIIDLNEDKLNNYDEYNLCGEKPFNKLKEIIEEKEILTNKEKTL